MKKYDVILFDLDGILTDSSQGIINSIIYALDKLNIPVENTDSLRRFLGLLFTILLKNSVLTMTK